MSEQTTYPKKEKEKKPSLRLGFTQDRDKTRKQHFIFPSRKQPSANGQQIEANRREHSTAHHQAQAQTQQKEEETNKKKRNI